MKILYLAHRIPYPPNKGDKIRSFHEIRSLTKAHEVHLACLVDDPADMKYRKDLETLCQRVLAVPLGRTRSRIAGLVSLLSGGAASTGYFYSPALQRTLNRWISSETYDAAVCFSTPMAEYLFRAPAWNGGRRSIAGTPPRRVMDFCDVDSDKWRQYARESSFPGSLLFGIESRRLLRYEMRVNQAFDHSLFVSRPEADLFAELFPGARNVHAVSNGVDHAFFSPDFSGHVGSAKPAEPPEPKLHRPALLFTGAMDYHANVDGVAWFADEMLPAIRSRCPEAVLYIVGSRPGPKVRALGARPGIHVTGFVQDVRPFYAQADVCVIPLRLARGVQNKVLEAMSMARPVVATSRANQGIRAVPGEHLLVRDTAAGFQEAVLSLLEDRTAGEDLGRRARAFVCARHDWDRNMAGLEACLA
ncbi:MAG: TIGR03087 family PEP-CTERM/XrtA system glycosyltransferase [Deltaproteobacteria bacterium]|nr:TIGR03087 family PEP-CTERM/XrtA system glycosyltransferase [Deltaproteobacteria bacterium]